MTAHQPNGLKKWMTLKRKVVKLFEVKKFSFQSCSIFQSVWMVGRQLRTFYSTFWNFCPAAKTLKIKCLFFQTPNQVPKASEDHIGPGAANYAPQLSPWLLFLDIFTVNNIFNHLKTMFLSVKEEGINCDDTFCWACKNILWDIIL